MHDIVVARHHENCDWVDALPADFCIHLYNKGAPLPQPEATTPRKRVIQRPNQGRESETYLHHLATTEPSGPGFTVFTQGDPFEHSPDFLNLLQHPADWQPIQPLSWQFTTAANVPPRDLLARQTTGQHEQRRIRPELFSLYTWDPLFFLDPGTSNIKTVYLRDNDLPEGTNIAAHFLQSHGLPERASQASAHAVGRFAYGAIFAVRNDILSAMPKPAIATLRRASLGHWVHGFLLERLWLHIFGAPFYCQIEADAEASTFFSEEKEAKRLS